MYIVMVTKTRRLYGEIKICEDWTEARNESCMGSLWDRTGMKEGFYMTYRPTQGRHFKVIVPKQHIPSVIKEYSKYLSGEQIGYLRGMVDKVA